MKTCTICKEVKPLTEFHKNKTRRDGLQTLCKQCSKEKSKGYYKRNREKHSEIVKERKEKLRDESRKFVWDWLSTHNCVDCGEDDIIVLEFDHLRDKEISISRATSIGWSVERLQKEINKCEVRCANCHRRKTARDFKWKILEFKN